jgi:hypothetical protein
VHPGLAEHVVQEGAGPVEHGRLTGEGDITGDEPGHLDHPCHRIKGLDRRPAPLARQQRTDGRERVERGGPRQLGRGGRVDQQRPHPDLAGHRQRPVDERQLAGGVDVRTAADGRGVGTDRRSCDRQGQPQRGQALARAHCSTGRFR